MHLKHKPPRMADMLPGTEFGEIESVVAKALSKKPDDRYASAVEMAAALEAVAPRGGRLVTPVAGIAVQEPSGPAGNVKATMMSLTPPPPQQQIVSQVVASRESTPLPAALAEAGAMISVSPRTSGYAPTEPDGRILAPGRSALPFSRRTLAIAGGGVLLLVIIIAIAAGGGEPKPAQPVATAGKDAGSDQEIQMEPGVPGPADQVVNKAAQLIKERKVTAARELLVRSREVFPDDARLPFMAGKLMMAQMWWSDGIRQFKEAVRIDPAMRDDPELIKEVLRGFITTPSYNAELAQFLRETIGAGAKPYLEETARTNPNATVRARAAAELKRY